MAKKPKVRTGAAAKPGARDGVAGARGGKKPKGLAAVGFLRSQGTRSFRKQRAGS